jgi:hypothetical protein
MTDAPTKGWPFSSATVPVTVFVAFWANDTCIMNTKISVKRLVIFVFISDEFCKNWVKNDLNKLGLLTESQTIIWFSNRKQTQNV